MDEWLSTATDEERTDFFQSFRDLHATADPDKHKSMSHLHFKEKRNVLSAEDRQLIIDENRFNNFGRPKMRDVSVRVGRPDTAPPQRPATADDDRAASKARIEELKKSIDLKKELYESKVPIKWAMANLGPQQSAYSAFHGANMHAINKNIADSAAERRNRMPPLGLCPTLGFGSVDPNLYQHRAAAFPVARSFLATTRPHADSYDTTKPTTYGLTHGTSAGKMDWQLSAEDRRATEGARAFDAVRMTEFQERVKRSNVPLGSSAIFNQIDPKTAYQSQLVRYPEAAYRQDDSHTRLIGVYSGPTGPVGACAPAEGGGLVSSAHLAPPTAAAAFSPASPSN